MLTRFNKILLGLLAVQLVLAALVLLRDGDAAKLEATPLVPGFDAALVTRVQVHASGQDKPVDLVKRGDGWVLASHFDYPADPQKVADALAPIAKLAAAEPVATSASRHKQLRVADADFERKLVITAGGKDTTIVIGGASGLRRTAVRLGGDDRVWGVTGLSTFALGASARDWVPRTYYETPRDQISKLVVTRGASTVELERVPAPAPAAGSGSAAPAPAADTWKVTIDGVVQTPAAGEQLDTMVLQGMISDAASIDAQPADPRRDASQPAAVVTIHRKDGTDVLDLVAVDESYWVKQRGLERATLVDKDRLKALVEASRAMLFTKVAPATPAP